MEFTFPVSGVEAPLWLPPVVAFVISFFTSMAGVSGAFLLLPFQVSVLHFNSPAVSPTNLVFNICGIPGGIYRYLKEKRLVWPLTLAVLAGTLPGVILGVLLRLRFLSDPKPFKAFAGCVLLVIGLKLFQEVARAWWGRSSRKETTGAGTGGVPGEWKAEVLSSGWSSMAFRFQGKEYRVATHGIFLFSFLVGVVGGAYGIGGGAIVAPIFVTYYRLPVHAVAGATLMGTFATSLVGIVIYQVAAPFVSATGIQVAPDWLLGILFGIGGFAGMYLGARAQRFVPSAWLKLMLGLIVLVVAVRYIGSYLLG